MDYILNHYGSGEELSFIRNDPFAGEMLDRLKKHDAFSYYHSVNVACCVAGIDQVNPAGAGVNRNTLLRGALLHDIGKVHVPTQILRKATPLSAEEFHEIFRHPLYGEEILKGKVSREVLQMVLYHHERCDGSGYPYGLTGGEISVAVHVVAVADSYCAMTEDRPYGRVFSPLEAINELKKSSVNQNVVRLLEKSVWDKTGR